MALPPEWTSEQQAMLEHLASEKRTAREIAAAIGVTRNAVIGRARREGVKLLGPKGRPPSARTGGKPKGYRHATSDAVHRTRPLGAHAYTLDERAAALAARLAGASWRVSAQTVGASTAVLANCWQHDPEVRDAALATLQRAKRMAWRERCARLAGIEQERQAVASHNADVLAGLDNRVATVAHRRLAGENLAAIAKDFGFTRERARQLFMKAVTAGLKEPPGVNLLRDRPVGAVR